MDFTRSAAVVVPLCVYIALGVLANKIHWLDEDTGAKMNSFIFKALFPLLMFNNMISAGDTLKSGGAMRLPLFLVVCSSVLLVIYLLVVPLFLKDKKQQGAFIQGVFRGNTVLFALPVVETLTNGAARTLASICIAVLVPFYNITCVVILQMKRGGKVEWKNVLMGIITNPLILGAVAGILFVLSGLKLPDMLMTPLQTLAACVTPMSLVILGARLKMSGLKKDAGILTAACIVKLVLTPIIMMTAAVLLGIKGDAFAVVLAVSSVPPAVSSYTMAEKMGSDGSLAGEIVAVCTVVSMFTVFAVVSICTGLGLIV